MHSNFNGLKEKNMNFKTAKEYIEYLDEQSGENCSNETDKLADVMEDYAKMYHERQLKLLGIADVVGQSEQLRAFKNFLQSEYHLPVSNRMVDEFEQKQSS